MVKHILVGVDGSRPSVEAAHYAMDLAEQTKAKLTFLFVIETPQVIPVGPLSGYVTTSSPRSQDDVKKAEAIVEAVAKERSGLPITTRVELGSPADVMCDLAKELNVDLLMVGARGHNAAQRFLVGSVSDRVVHHAPCPVLVVRR
jgi:nucleotide-binding universal stress UspA family protein